MDKLIEESASALKAGLYQVALNSVITIPDICCALASDSGQTSANLYKKWIDEFVASKYDGTITGEDVYKLRCALLHQGKLNHDYPRDKKIVFQLPGGNGTIHNAILKDALFLNIKIFCLHIIHGCREREKQNLSNERLKSNSPKIVTYHPDGLLPYVVGVTVLA